MPVLADKLFFFIPVAANILDQSLLKIKRKKKPFKRRDVWYLWFLIRYKRLKKNFDVEPRYNLKLRVQFKRRNLRSAITGLKIIEDYLEWNFLKKNPLFGSFFMDPFLMFYNLRRDVSLFRALVSGFFFFKLYLFNFLNYTSVLIPYVSGKS